MWRTCEPDFNLGRHLIQFLQSNAFYCELSRHIQKRQSRDLPTAAVTYDQKADEVVMYINPDFAAKLSNAEIHGLLMHEFDHLVFGHLNARRRTPGHLWNIGADLAINSLIVTNDAKSNSGRDIDPSVSNRSLPLGALIPGQRPWIDPDQTVKQTPEQKALTDKLCDLIEKFPTQKASEWYFNKIQEFAEENGMNSSATGSEFTIDSIDDHSGWDDLPEDMREYVEGKVKSIIEKAVRHADQQSDGWGNIPVEIREEIRRSVSSIINWRMVLRQFVGSLVRGNRTTSIKRINRRFPYIHPGVKRGYTAKLIVAIDESGSVGDQMLEMFFAELEQLTRKVDVTLLHFDCYCGPKDLYEWKKGVRPKLKREKMGGTNFDAPTQFVNDPKNRGRWDGLLIMTDGQAPAPGPSRIKRGWVLGQGCKLEFSSNEIQINLSKERPLSGAWR